MRFAVFGRKLPLFMKHRDMCEVEIEGIGMLRNKIENVSAAPRRRNANHAKGHYVGQ